MAFAVLCVGIGIDFGIQFGVRYRAERYEINHLHKALINCARHVGIPLTLAATATAAGFMSFLPTHYKGLSPEDGGTDSGRYPNPRNVTLGLNLGF